MTDGNLQNARPAVSVERLGIARHLADLGLEQSKANIVLGSLGKTV